MPRKNPRGVASKETQPDNQQERLDIASWICGFVDGEGCFCVSFIKNKTTSTGWQIFPEFVVTQGMKSEASLTMIQSYFDCGKIYRNKRYDNHKEDLLRYCVRSQKDLLTTIIPFFKQYVLQTSKKNDFRKFEGILKLMSTGIHKTEEGMIKIALIVQTMNRKVPSRFLESSETTRQTPI